MSLDMNAFLEDIKRAAIEAVNAGKPFAFTLGNVTSISPLKVQIDQKLELAAPQLILTNAVRDYNVNMTVNHVTESALSEHQHNYSGNTEKSEGNLHTHVYTGNTEKGGVDEHIHTYAGITEKGGSEAHAHPITGITASVNLSHSHEYSGTKTFRVHMGLKRGEQVLLLRIDGGQKYIILDRVEAPA